MKFKAAAQWASFVIRELETKTRSYKNWDEFCEQVKVAFRDHNKKDAAQWKLEQLKQGTRSATEFFIEFKECKALARYNDEGYITLLIKGLLLQVLEWIYTLEMIPTTYEQ